MIKSRFFIFFMLYFCVQNTISQEKEIKFEHISLEEGLSQSSVYTIVQDKKGFMWFGTLDGLNKFDGYEITKYRNDPDNPYSIPDNYINVIFVDNKGTLWIGTRSKGLCKYDRITNRFLNIKYDASRENLPESSNVTSIFEYPKGILWIGTANGMNKYNINFRRFQHFTFGENTSNNKDINFVNTIIGDKAGNLWIATNAALFKFDTKSNEYKRYHIPQNKLPKQGEKRDKLAYKALHLADNHILWIGTNKGLHKVNLKHITSPVLNPISYFHQAGDEESISSNMINTIVEDNEGILWIGTEKGGLNRFNPKTGVFQEYKHDAARRKSLSTNHVLTIYQDRSDILWVGTYLGGINKWNRAAEDLYVFRHNPYAPNSLSSNQVRTIYEDKSGIIWVGTVDKGLNRWNMKENKFVHYKPNPDNPKSLSNPHVRSILEDSKGNFWIGTDGGGLHKFKRKEGTFNQYRHEEGNPNSLSNDHIWKIYEDSKGNLWIATFGGGLNRFDIENETCTAFKHKENNPNSLSNNNVTTILEDYKGYLWIGTMGGGLNKTRNTVEHAPQQLDFQVFRHINEDTTSLGSDRIYSIVEDSQNTLWIGTKGNLNKYIREKQIFKKYSEDDGFPNNVIMGILEDNSGNLWISTNGGLSKFNKKTEEVRNYGLKDGLQSNEFLVGSFCKSKSGEMFFGGINGFNAFYPDKVKDNPHKPPIVITGFKIRNKEVELDTAISEKNHLQLTYKDDVISFDFVALDYIFPEKNQYAYKMENFDDDWIEYGTKRYVTYTNLPAGEYVFKVIGSNNDGIWNNEGTSIRVSITPPFWKTWWFYVLIGLTVATVIALYIMQREQRLKRDKRRLEQTVKERTAEILQQKEAIETQNYELEQQKHAIEEKNRALQDQKVEIEMQSERIKNTYMNIKMLSEIGQEVTSHLLIDSIIETVYVNINNVLEAPVFAIGIFNEKQNRLNFSGAKDKGITLETFHHNLDREGLLSTYSFNNQSDILIRDYENEYKKYLQKPAMPIKDYTKSIIYLPLVVKEKRVGVITVQSFKKETYSEYHLNILKNLAVYVAIAIDNAKAYQQIESQKEELTAQRDKIKIRNEELKKAYAKIKETARLKQIFLANMSHEIRTPLNAINGYTNLLLNSELEKKQWQYVSNIKTSANSLLVIINDILDLSKIEAGKLTVEHVDFDFKDIISNFFSSIKVKAAEKDIQLHSHIGENVPQYLKGDPYRLTQILTNLVGNGIKFTSEKGWVRMQVEVSEQSENSVKLKFQVSDNGIGIENDKLDEIFDIFTQSSTDTTRKYGGTGLGLSIVKQLVELQGGKISVESDPGKGSIFTFYIRFDKSTGERIAKKIDSYKIAKNVQLRNLRILIVEDNPINQEIAIDTIRLYNDQMIIDAADNGKKALEKLKQKDYDIIIMDIQMPELDGIEATRIIRRDFNPPKNQIPILGMSAHAMKSEKDKCLNTGMDEYLTKPFEPEELFAKIDACTGKKTKTKMKHEAIEKQKDSNREFRFIDLSYLPKSYDKSPDRTKKILSMCLTNIPQELESIKQNMGEKNWKAISDIAHSIKTLMYYLGLVEARELLEDVEHEAKDGNKNNTVAENILKVEKIWDNAYSEIERAVELL